MGFAPLNPSYELMALIAHPTQSAHTETQDTLKPSRAGLAGHLRLVAHAVPASEDARHKVVRLSKRRNVGLICLTSAHPEAQFART